MEELIKQKNMGNIYTFSSREIVSFLTKVGQHEAAKVVQKYELNGEMLMSFGNHSSSREDVTEAECMTLWRCINLIQLNPLSNIRTNRPNSLVVEDEGENPLKSGPNSPVVGSPNRHQMTDQRTSKSKRENSYYTLQNVQIHSKSRDGSQNNSSPQYFIFTMNSGQRNTKYNHFPPGFNTNHRLSTTSSGYLRPTSVLVPIYEEIIVNHIQTYAAPDDGTVPQVVIRTDENQNKRNNSVFCDFLLNLCCFSCSSVCHTKQ